MASTRTGTWRTRVREPLIALGLLFFLSSLVLACAESPSVLRPASPGAAEIANLFWIETVVALIIFFGVEAALIYVVIRFRARPDSPEPRQIHGHLPLEITWTIIPFIIVAAIFVGTVNTMAQVTAQQANPLNVKVTGHQWWWEVAYPNQNITTATDMHLPEGQFVRTQLVSVDVIHSFWAPRLFGKQDVIPGHTNWVNFTPTESGDFHGLCVEFCGDQHANMGFYAIVEPRGQFDDWVRRMQTPATLPTSGQAAQGVQAFQTGGCIGCHTIDGMPQAQGKIGPNLTHFGSRKSIAALTLPNTPENLAIWLANPQKVKPGNKMVIPALSQEAIQNLVALLDGLK